jgi:hypothetical protein
VEQETCLVLEFEKVPNSTTLSKSKKLVLVPVLELVVRTTEKISLSHLVVVD